MAFPFDIYEHRVFQPAIIRISHPAPPGSIILKLTIHVWHIPLQHNSLANIYCITNASLRQITIDLYCSVLENESRLHQSLALYLNAIGINTWSADYDNLVRAIMECGLAMSDRVIDREDKRVVLPLQVNVLARHVEHSSDDLGRVFEESEAELARRKVAAKGSSMEEVLKKVRVKEETDCMVCLEKLKVRRNGYRMPCSHIFHGDCIKMWLKHRHYCPICGYEKPSIGSSR